jgi:hypothetical protein
MMIFRRLRTPLLMAHRRRVAAFSSVSKDGARNLRVEEIDASALCAQADSLLFQDRAAAVPLYKRAAEQGDVDAMVKFAFALFENFFSPHFDFETAIEWCRRATDLGDVQARALLGRMLMSGFIDVDTGVGHMVAAAQRGHVFGAFWPHEDLTRKIGGDSTAETKWLFEAVEIARELETAWWFVEGRVFPRNVVRAREVLAPLLKDGARASQCLSKLKEVAFGAAKNVALSTAMDMWRLFVELASTKDGELGREARWLASMQFGARKAGEAKCSADERAALQRVADLVGGAPSAAGDVALLQTAQSLLDGSREVPIEMHGAMVRVVAAGIQALPNTSFESLRHLTNQLTQGAHSIALLDATARLSVLASVNAAMFPHLQNAFALPPELTTKRDVAAALLYVGIVHRLVFFGDVAVSEAAAAVKKAVVLRLRSDAALRQQLEHETERWLPYVVT